MHLRMRAGGRRGRGPAVRWRRRGPATHGGGGAGGRRRTEVEAQAAAQGRSRRRQPDGVSSAIRNPEAASVRLRIWPRMAKSRVVWSVILTFGTGWWHKPVPKVHWYRLVKVHQKLHANRCTFGTGFSHQPIPKGFSLFFFPVLLKQL